MLLDFSTCLVRSWRLGDEAALARHANNRKVWLALRDRFPHPYTLADAEAWVRQATEAVPETNFAIELEGDAAGGIGLELQSDVNRCSAEIGYWLGEPFWGRGIMSRVVREFTDWGFAAHDLTRIYAKVFEWNIGSMRVLENAGYQFEGRLRRAAIKDGKLLDEFMYARVR